MYIVYKIHYTDRLSSLNSIHCKNNTILILYSEHIMTKTYFQDIGLTFDHSSLSDRVYTAILELLINHKIRPGEKLREDEIASNLGVSRTPVREALHRLAADGLVELYPRRGCYAREITPRDITELYTVRLCLEVHAARRSMENLSEECIQWIDQLIERCHQLQGDEFIEAELQLDREIHKIINTRCRNSRLTRMLERLDHLAQFMRIVHFDRYDRARQNFEEHENIWRAMVARNESRMVKLLEKHLDNRRKCLLAHFHMMENQKETVQP